IGRSSRWDRAAPPARLGSGAKAPRCKCRTTSLTPLYKCCRPCSPSRRCTRVRCSARRPEELPGAAIAWLISTARERRTPKTIEGEQSGAIGMTGVAPCGMGQKTQWSLKGPAAGRAATGECSSTIAPREALGRPFLSSGAYTDLNCGGLQASGLHAARDDTLRSLRALLGQDDLLGRLDFRRLDLLLWLGLLLRLNATRAGPGPAL